MTPTTPSSRLIPNPPPLAPFVPPSRDEWDLVFQPVFDEFFFPPASVASPVPIEKAPAPVAHMSNDPYFGIPIPETVSEESSSSDVIPTTVYSDAPISEHLIEPKTYKDALTQSCWIEAMQEEINEFERLEVWELVPCSSYRKAPTCCKKNLSISKRNCQSGTMVFEGFCYCSIAFANVIHAGYQDTRRSTSGIQHSPSNAISTSDITSKRASEHESVQHYFVRTEYQLADGTNIKEMDKNRGRRQNRAREWKEDEKSRNNRGGVDDISMMQDHVP
ncbi:hypothetical protein Tco_1578699 [Tanacetum coccineum]